MYIYIYTDMFACTFTSSCEDTNTYIHIYIYIYLTLHLKLCRLVAFQMFLKGFAGWDPGRHNQKDRLQNHVPEFRFRVSVRAAVRDSKWVTTMRAYVK